mmetsp:Transcript_25255/g.32349  ORF Transcript_25255/g.32349 Transcript_25255/m.32349 type:complete len:237 (-) Transcript_25255:202-912(-)
MLEQISQHAAGISFRQIHLVDGNNDRNFRRLGVFDRLNGLRHDGVIGSDHENNNVSDIRAAGTHRRECCVTRCVEEADLVARLQLNLIGADMLGDAAGFASNNICRAQRVQKRGLTMVNVTHNGHDWWAVREIFWIVFDTFKTNFHIGFRHAFDGMAKFFGNQFGGVSIDNVIRAQHFTLLHHEFHDIAHAFFHPASKILQGDGFWKRDFDRDFLGLIAARAAFAFPLTGALNRCE